MCVCVCVCVCICVRVCVCTSLLTLVDDASVPSTDCLIAGAATGCQTTTHVRNQSQTIIVMSKSETRDLMKLGMSRGS
jgi:hypothetical protein